MSENPTPEAITTPPTDNALTVKYNHESRSLSPDEAVTYAQMGMKYEAMQPTLNRLHSLAASRSQSLEEYITAAESDAQQARLAEYTAALGDPQAAAARVAEETVAAETPRLRDQLAELTEAVEGIACLQDVPYAVQADARANHRTLLDAYLRYQWQQQTAVARNAAATAAAASAAVGSQSAPPPTDSTDSLTHAMVRGLHSVL